MMPGQNSYSIIYTPEDSSCSYCSKIYLYYCISYHKIYNTNWQLEKETNTQFCDQAHNHHLSNTLSSVGPDMAVT